MKNMFKKIALFTTAVLIFVSSINNIVSAEELNLNARYCLALDSKSKTVLYNKGGYLLVPMASTTKIMTALVAINYGDLERKVQISSRSSSIRGSTVGYKKGESVSIKELLYGLMLRSGNDAAIAIAEGISGSVEEFVVLMNEYANQIGLCNTHFESPHGLDSSQHYTTAYDLALITAKARESKLFNEIVQSKDVDGKQQGFTRNFHNINKILWQLPNATGVKTGFTGGAGKCLVSSVNIKGNDVIIVVLNSADRWKVTKKINDYVEKNYEFKKMFSKGDIVAEAALKNSSKRVKLVCRDDIIIPMRQGEEYNVKVVKPNKLMAPIKKNDAVGKICIYSKDKLVFSQSLSPKEPITKSKIIKKWKLFK